jgi:predicted esterase
MTQLLNALAPGAEVQIEVVRKEGGKTETLTAKLATLPETVPDKLPDDATAKQALAPRKPAGPPAKGPKGPKEDKPKDEPKKDAPKEVETGWLKRTTANRDREYFVFVPKDYDANISYALLLWLHPVGKGRDKDFEDLRDAWEEFCSKNHIILVAPKAETDNGWLPSESDSIVPIVREVMGQYTVDRQRVLAHGMGIGGQMAFYLGFSARDVFRGVATTGSVVAAQVKENIANQRLQFYVIAGGKDPLAKDIQESKEKLLANKFPTIYREIADMGHQYLDARTLLELVRWIDSLDRQ